MLNYLITSQTRIKLLKKFFLNSNITAHLRGLEAEFGESSNGIRIELNRFEEAGLLTSSTEGNKKIYQANTDHPLFPDIHNIILKEIGLNRIINDVIEFVENLMSVYLCGDFACGRDSRVIDLILIGKGIDTSNLNKRIHEVEEIINRKVNYRIYDNSGAEEVLRNMSPAELIPLWSNAVVN
jgi:predicted nucleotidyltransferase